MKDFNGPDLTLHFVEWLFALKHHSKRFNGYFLWFLEKNNLDMVSSHQQHDSLATVFHVCFPLFPSGSNEHLHDAQMDASVDCCFGTWLTFPNFFPTIRLLSWICFFASWFVFSFLLVCCRQKILLVQKKCFAQGAQEVTSDRGFVWC